MILFVDLNGMLEHHTDNEKRGEERVTTKTSLLSLSLSPSRMECPTLAI
jgi:hypothetical protein